MGRWGALCAALWLSPPLWAAAAGPDETVELAVPTAMEAAALKAAVALLESAESGRPIAAFLKERGIPVHFGDLPAGNHGAFGRDRSGRPVIVLARLAGPELGTVERGAVHLALVLAHEGTHARQDLEWDLPDSVDNECEAFLAELAVQHELRGRPGLPHATFEFELRYARLRSKGGVDAVVDQVREGYDQQVFQLAWQRVQGYPEARREAMASRLIAQWEAAGSLDRFRPLARLHKAAREPERRERLGRALARWQGLLKDFRAKVGGWPALAPEPPAPKSAPLPTGNIRQSLPVLEKGTIVWDGSAVRIP